MKKKYSILLIVLLFVQPIETFEMSKKELNIIAGVVGLGLVGLMHSIAKIKIGRKSLFVSGAMGFSWFVMVKYLLSGYTHMEQAKFRIEQHKEHIKKKLKDLEFVALNVKEFLEKEIFQEVKSQEAIIDIAVRDFLDKDYPMILFVDCLKKALKSIKSIQELYLEMKDESEAEEYIKYIESFDYKKYIEMINTYMFFIKTSDEYVKELGLKKLDSINSNIYSLMIDNGRRWYWSLPFFIIPV